jgi:hypothetical protein
MLTFEKNQIVIYNPNIENLPPIHERIHDIGIIRELTNTHALVFFPHMNGFLKINLNGLIKAPSNITLPKATMSEKMAKIEYNMFNVNNLKIFSESKDFIKKNSNKQTLSIFEYNQEPIDVQPN